MKRLQLRHHDEIFESRSLALEFFNNIVDLSHTASTVFGKSLYAEPMVAKYLDSESNVQLLFAIGVDSPNAPYHIIDSKEIYEKLKENENAILSEVERATSAETALNKSIENEVNRALSAETESLRIEIDEAKSEAINNATTSATTEARKIAAEEVAKIVDGADTSYDTLKEIADWILNDTTGAAQMANDIKEIKTDINEINGEINTLNSDASVKGSVKNSVNEGINESMIFNTLPITNITPDEAFRNSSLIRKVIHEGKTYYYVSNKASEMSIETKEGTLVNLRDYVISLQETNGNLNTEILTLKSTIETLNNELSGLNETIKDLKEQIENGPGDSVNEEQVKEIIKNYLQGVTNEIQISESESKDKLTIGFADDAIFG